MPPPLPPKPLQPNRASLSFLFLFLLSLVVYVSLSPSRKTPSPSSSSSSSSRNAPADSFSAPHRLFLSLHPGANATIAAHLRALTLRPHLAGTPAAARTASYVISHLRAAGLRVALADYYPLLSYPASASLALLRPDGALVKPLPLAEPADLEAAAVPPYHAYSPSGSAVAPPVYVNYGREDDYSALDRLGVDVRGCVAVVRRGGGYRGAVVARAAARGVAAVLMFKAADHGGVPQDSVYASGRGGGDGDIEDARWASDAARVGRRVAFGGEERGWTGDAFKRSNVLFDEDRKLAKIQNVFGIIRGSEEPDRYIILGNHRDAWTFGAVDPNSGTAALLDVARRYGSLLRSGWRPRRTIILCSWDAEEFGMIGSTEWVEQNLGRLSSKAVVYLNVDCAVQGDGFFASATPQLDKLIVEVTKQIQDPDFEARTVYESWIVNNGGISKIERLSRADSDFSAFLHLAGVPSVDFYYGDAVSMFCLLRLTSTFLRHLLLIEVFPGYHTVFDSYKWMVEHGDPSFHRHVAIAEIWGLLGLRLADDLVLPFDYPSYSAQLHEHATALSALLDGGGSVQVQPINSSIDELTVAIREAVEESKKLQEVDTTEDFAALRRRAFNDRLMLAERGFLEAEGLKGRPCFRHLLYSPPEDSESKLSFFPGIADAISQARKYAGEEEQLGIQHEIWRVARAIQRAAAALRGELI
ncbi:unnamed protein product [Musa acuminata subsp. malaccensis]|uniref:(wild Malaysian banana) hypothetical protein n=1 Tax=Musa acuminata subsp. malaccensis TaxID=214687 RepID=A0A804J035_MUSAM|nr:unnamed protein product [Musa acuminata subsp. malaccensis]